MGLNLPNGIKGISNLFSITEGETLIKKGITPSLQPGTDMILLPSLNQNINWEVGTTIDTNASPQIFGEVTVALIEGFEYRGHMIQFTIRNESGAVDNYDITFSNVTQSKTFASGTLTISDGGVQSTAIVLDETQASIGDTLRVTISDGVLGTAGGKTKLGSISYVSSYITEITGKLTEIKGDEGIFA